MKKFSTLICFVILTGFISCSEEETELINEEQIALDEEIAFEEQLMNSIINEVESLEESPETNTAAGIPNGRYALREYYTNAVLAPEGPNWAFWSGSEQLVQNYLIDQVGRKKYVVVDDLNGFDFHIGIKDGTIEAVSLPEVCGRPYPNYDSCSRGINIKITLRDNIGVALFYYKKDGQVYFLSRPGKNFPGIYSMATMAPRRTEGLRPALLRLFPR